MKFFDNFFKRKSHQVPEENEITSDNDSDLTVSTNSQKAEIYAKPCPYCGCNFLISTHLYCHTDYFKKNGYVIKCPSCGLQGPFKDSVQEAANAWNDFVNRCNCCGGDDED